MQTPKIKKQTIGKNLWRATLTVARHPFLTFFAGFVAAMAMAAGSFVFFYYQLVVQPVGDDHAVAKGGSVAKICNSVFSAWDQRQKSIDDTVQAKTNDPFQNFVPVDQTPK
jgi:uncharacterized membrane protein YfcA